MWFSIGWLGFLVCGFSLLEACYGIALPEVCPCLVFWVWACEFCLVSGCLANWFLGVCGVVGLFCLLFGVGFGGFDFWVVLGLWYVLLLLALF